MCVQYWPAAKNREEIYGGVGITVEQEEQLANFMIRTIRYTGAASKLHDQDNQVHRSSLLTS